MAVVNPRSQASAPTRADLDEDQLDKLEELYRNDQVRHVHEREKTARERARKRKSVEAFEDLFGEKAIRENAIGGAEATQWVVEGLLEHDTISRWIGVHGHYKSFMAISLGMCVARGIPWMGFRTAPGAVLYVANEGGTGVGKRVEAFRRRHGLDVQAWVDFRVWSDGIRIGGPNWERWCDTVYEVMMPSLIVFDTQSKCAPDFDENNPAQMAQMVNHLEYLRRTTNACILLLHHPIKNGTGETRKQGRGSDTVTAGVESEAFVERTKPLTCRLQVTRHKDEENWTDVDRWETFELARVGWEVEVEDYIDGEEVKSMRAVTSLALDRRLGGQTEAGTPLDVLRAATSEIEVPTSGEQGASNPVRMARLVAEAGPGGVEPADLRAQFVELLTRINGTAPADGADRKTLARLRDRGHLIDHPDIRGRLLLSHEGHGAAGLPCMRATCR
jgi:hypothetical protein